MLTLQLQHILLLAECADKISRTVILVIGQYSEIPGAQLGFVEGMVSVLNEGTFNFCDGSELL